MASSSEIELTLKLSTKTIQEDLDISYPRQSSLQSLLEELPSEYNINLDKVEVAVPDEKSTGKFHVVDSKIRIALKAPCTFIVDITSSFYLDEADTVEKEYYSKTLDELELEDGDLLIIKEGSMSDAKRKYVIAFFS